MSGIQGVTIEIRQGATLISIVTTGGDGKATTILNPGEYTLTFAAPGKNSVQMPLTVSEQNTELIFAFPFAVIGGIDLSARQNMTPANTFQVTDLVLVNIANSSPQVVLSPQESKSLPTGQVHVVAAVFHNP
jgi:hypothetical protein